jgi:FK506-binding nuclear protein
MSISVQDKKEKIVVSNPVTKSLNCGIKFKDINVGSGDKIEAGEVVTIHYIAKLQNGKVFKSTFAKASPLTITVGVGELLKCLDLGIVGMKIGGVREIISPATMAFGEKMINGIPINSEVIFEVHSICKHDW